jgi:hypothetical protein
MVDNVVVKSQFDNVVVKSRNLFIFLSIYDFIYIHVIL